MISFATFLLLIAAANVHAGHRGSRATGRRDRRQLQMGMMDEPTFSPTRSPSSSPSGSPTVSFQPSTKPSTTPSLSPSTVPSLTPSSRPSGVPSVQPSETPSEMPSSSPTQVARIPCGTLNESPIPRQDNFTRFLVDFDSDPLGASITVPLYIYNSQGVVNFYYNGNQAATTGLVGDELIFQDVFLPGTSRVLEVTVETTGDGSQAYWILRVPCP